METKHKTNEEIEIKLALSSFADYLKLVGCIGNPDAKTIQTNIFYDTPQKHVSDLGYALRLRIEPPKGVITLKSTTTQKGTAAIRKEIEEVIGLEHAIQIHKDNSLHTQEIPALQFLRSKLKDISALEPLLKFENERIKKEIHLNEQSYNFEVDKTTFHDGSVFYELEIELERITDIETATFKIEKLFSMLEIEFRPMKKSKFERALEIDKLK